MKDNAALIQTLLGFDQAQYLQAREALVALGPSIVPELLRAAETVTDDRELWRILVTLGQIGSPEATPLMIECLNSSTSAIRALAAQFLASTRDIQAVDSLIELLAKPEDTNSLSWIADALGTIGDERAYGPLITFLHRAKSNVDRCAAIRALTLMHRPEAIQHVRYYADDPDRHVRDRVQEAMSRLGPIPA